MSEVKRYDFTFGYRYDNDIRPSSWAEESDAGEFVLASDYDALAAENKRLKVAFDSMTTLAASHAERASELDRLLRESAGQPQQGEPPAAADEPATHSEDVQEPLTFADNIKRPPRWAYTKGIDYPNDWNKLANKLRAIMNNVNVYGDQTTDEELVKAARAALAPAAVVMPERMTTIPEGKTISYAAGYEAALDAVANLNRNTVPLELLARAAQYIESQTYFKFGEPVTFIDTVGRDISELRAILAGDKS